MAVEKFAEQKPEVLFVRDSLKFIQYNGLDGDEFHVASCLALNHPRLGKEYVRTSTVIKKNEDGSFETRNTIYVPVDVHFHN